MERLINRYLKEHLSINISEESYGYNGRCITIKLQLDNEVISSDSYSIKSDDD